MSGCDKLPLIVKSNMDMLYYVTSHRTISHDMTPHYITLHYVTLHYVTLHYITLRYVTSHYITLPYVTLHYSCKLLIGGRLQGERVTLSCTEHLRLMQSRLPTYLRAMPCAAAAWAWPCIAPSYCTTHAPDCSRHPTAALIAG